VVDLLPPLTPAKSSQNQILPHRSPSPCPWIPKRWSESLRSEAPVSFDDLPWRRSSSLPDQPRPRQGSILPRWRHLHGAELELARLAALARGGAPAHPAGGACSTWSSSSPGSAASLLGRPRRPEADIQLAQPMTLARHRVAARPAAPPRACPGGQPLECSRKRVEERRKRGGERE
jgi:hypothetical protein